MNTDSHPASPMPPSRHKETGIRLPKSLRDELKLDERGAPRSKGKGGIKALNQKDRKAQRKGQRQDKKPRRAHQFQHAWPNHDGDDEDIDDPFEESAEDEPVLVPRTRERKNIEPKTKPLKPALKPVTKRKAPVDDEDDDEKQPSRKRLSKAVQDKLAKDDAEIAYFEKKLKLKGKKSKSFEDEGLGFVLEGLYDDYLDGEAYAAAKAMVGKKKRKLKFVDDEDMEEDEDDSQDGDDGEEDGDEDGKNGSGEDDEGEEEAPQPSRKKPKKAVLDKLAEDDTEIAFLEKKLKIKHGGIPKSLEDDGLDFLLEGLKDDYLNDGPEKKSKDKKRSKFEDSSEEDEDEDEEMGNEDDGLDALMESSDSDGPLDGDEDSKDEDENEDENKKDNKEKNPTAAPKRENPYAPPVPFVASAAKYIPPSLRKAATTESEQLLRLRRQVQGLLNRLSEANLVTILNNLEDLYRSNPRGDVTNLLTDIIISTVSDKASMLDTFMILQGGFVAGIYKIMGTDVGAHVVQRVVEEFHKHHEKNNGIADPATASKECTNLMSFLSELYNFGVVGAVLIFDFIRSFLTELTELHTELLLKIVRNSGPQLRADDPSALKSLVLLLQPAIAKAGGQQNLSIRTQFMIETLANLKNNRLKETNAATQVTTEATTRMRKLLGSLNARRLRATEPLRASLDDIKNTETKGKWWLIGASWAGNTNNPVAITPFASDSKSTKPTYEGSDSDIGANVDFTVLARQHRMNTDIRRAIFVTLLSAHDFADAHTRLIKLRLKRSQEREIPRVLLHCAAGEAAYNHYYTLVAQKLCGSSRALRMTFQFALWEHFRQFGEDDGSSMQAGDDRSDGEDGDGDSEAAKWNTKAGMRKLVNLARLYGALVAEGSLGLGILKTLNWAYLQEPTRDFLKVLFTTVLTKGDGRADSAFGPWQALQDQPELCRGVLHFLKKRMKKAEFAADEEQREKVLKGVEKAKKVLQGTLKEV